ncbi:MAG: DinB family protein [Fimbriimonadaceae bacterium]|nr:DinB family protein [Fimbriimonadaceae bacterium]
MNENHAAAIARFRAQMGYAHARMIATFSAVPEDRIDWSPSPTAKSALAIGSHCVDANRAIIEGIRGGEMPEGPNWSFRLPDKQAVLDGLAETFAAYNEALDHATPELWAEVTETPGGPSTRGELADFLGWHLAEHAGQIEYLQTCWDDQESHYPEG